MAAIDAQHQENSAHRSPFLELLGPENMLPLRLSIRSILESNNESAALRTALLELLTLLVDLQPAFAHDLLGKICVCVYGWVGV